MNDVLSDRHSRGQINCSPASVKSIGRPFQEQMCVFIKIRSRTGVCFHLKEVHIYMHWLEHHAPVRALETESAMYRKLAVPGRKQERDRTCLHMRSQCKVHLRSCADCSLALPDWRQEHVLSL